MSARRSTSKYAIASTDPDVEVPEQRERPRRQGSGRRTRLQSREQQSRKNQSRQNQSRQHQSRQHQSRHKQSGRRPGQGKRAKDSLLALEIRGRNAYIFFAVVAVAATVFMLVRLFAGGTIGLSDQGDGGRLLCGLGLREGNPYNTSTTQYLYTFWPDHHWYGEDCGAPGTGEPYNSTELVFAAVAKALTHVVLGSSGLDLRVLGVMFSVIVGLLIAGIALAVPGRLLAKAATSVALLLVLADGAFAGYFVSAYSEPAGFVGVLLLILSTLIYFRVQEVRWTSLALLAGAALFTVTAKTQTASLLASVVPLMLVRPSWGTGVAARQKRSRRYEPLRVVVARQSRLFAISRWPALAASLALLICTATYLGNQPERFTVQNDYAAVFVEMLPHSPNPARDLQDLGLPADMLSSSGLAINAPGSTAAKPEFYDFTDKAGLGSRFAVYLRQPGRFAGMFSRGIGGMSVLRADYIYSYPPSAGRGPNQFECRVCVLQKAWKGLFAGGSPLLVLVFLACVGVCGFAVGTRRDVSTRAAGATGLFLGSAVIVQFWVVLLTDGASDLIKHLVFANLMFALLMVFAGVTVGCLRNADRDE